MKKLLPFYIALFTSLFSGFYQAQSFVWVKGSNLTSQQGAYGNVSVPSNTTTPGARSGAVSWKDANGDFWLFGGEGYDFNTNSGYLNDLWKYNITTNQWTWVNGDNIIAQMGIYGTQGTPAASNKPGGRANACSWKDVSGNLWLFGGYGYGTGAGLGDLNDLWKYDPVSNQWTWISGSNVINPTASYGTLGIPAPANVPGPRTGASTWADGNGFLWMFGGNGTSTTTTYGYLNDMWKYNISTNLWTWVSGANTINLNGVYGTLNTTAATNLPGGRNSAATWLDQSGNMWMMGGYGYDINVPLTQMMNDLWQYDFVTNQWTWRNGSSAGYQNGSYGTQGLAGTGNIPGARQAPVTWTDATGNLWLHGGHGVVATGNIPSQLNDLWKYNIAANQWMWVRGSAVQDQFGVYGTQGTGSSGNRPGARYRGNGWTDANNNLWLFGGDGLASTGPKNKMNDLWKIPNCYITPVTFTIISNDAVICSGISTSLTASGASSYLWSHNSSTLSNVIITPSITTTYTVSTTDGIGCTYYGTYTQTVSACDGLTSSSLLNQNTSVFPNPSAGNLTVHLPEGMTGATFMIRNETGQLVLKTEVRSHEVIDVKLPAGIYFYEISEASTRFKTGKLAIE